MGRRTGEEEVGGQKATGQMYSEKNIPLLLTVLREMLDTEEQKL